MSKKLIVTSSILLLLLLPILSSSVLANPVSVPLKPDYATITIDNPRNDSYTGSSIQLSFTIITNSFHQYPYYSLGNYKDTNRSTFYDNHCFISIGATFYEFTDYQIAEKITISNDNGYGKYNQFTLVGNTSITNLAKGGHTIEVKYGSYDVLEDEDYKVEYAALASASVMFTIDSNISPDANPTVPLPTANPNPKPPRIPTIIKVSTPQNNFQTNANSVQLIFNVTAPQSAYANHSEIHWVFYEVDWKPNRQTLYYQDLPFHNATQALLDNEHYEFREFNTTLSDIPRGTHKIKITALGVTISKGFGSEQDTKEITFTIGEQTLLNSINLLPFNQAETIVIFLLVAVITILSIIILEAKFHKKHKGEKLFHENHA